MKRGLFIFLTLLVGCKKEYNETLIELQKPPVIERVNKFTLQLQDTLQISLPATIPNNLSLIYEIHQDSIYYYTYGKHKFAKVNLAKSTVDSIVIPSHLVTGNLRAICQIAPDTVVVTQDFPAKLFLIAKKEVTEISLPKLTFTTTNKSFKSLSETLPEEEANFLIDFKNLHYQKDKRLLHIGIQPIDAFLVEGFENSERIGVFDLQSKKWVETYAAPEGILKNRGNKTFGYRMSQKYMLLKNDTVFVNYRNDHFIYFYKNGNYLGKFPHTSSVSKEMYLPFEIAEMDDPEFLKQYKYATPKYGGFYYHKKLKLYSRLYFDEQDPIDENGRYKPGDLLRDVYAVFLNEKFEAVGEYKFPNGSIAYIGVAPMADGYLVFDINATDQTKYGLKYRYKIVPVTQ